MHFTPGILKINHLILRCFDDASQEKNNGTSNDELLLNVW